MNAKKKVLLALGGVAAALVLAAVIFVLSFDINSYRPRIEAAASEAMGLEVRIAGQMGLSLFPFGVSAQDIHVTHKGSEIISVENLKLGVGLMPLLKKQIKVTCCEIVKPAITILKDSDGKYNFESPEKKPTKGQPETTSSMNNLKLSKGALVYIDKKTGEKTELKDFNLLVRDLSIADTSEGIIKNIAFTGNMDCKEIRTKDLEIHDVRSSIKADRGVIGLKAFTMDIFGAKAEGDASIDNSEANPIYKINLKAPKLDFEKLEESFGTKKAIGGKGDLFASLTLKGKGSRSLISSMDGTFSLQGKNLIIYTMDLDKVLSSFETSQEFNLVDLGAFFIAGPLGNVATKGYDYANVYKQSREGRGAVTEFISQWKIKDGVADATDCAFATRHNRVALKGKLNLVSEQYDNVIVALLDDKGCARFKQGINGPFRSPRIGAVSSLETLLGPILNLYRKATGIVQGEKCEVFYNGSVQQPPK